MTGNGASGQARPPGPAQRAITVEHEEQARAGESPELAPRSVLVSRFVSSAVYASLRADARARGEMRRPVRRSLMVTARRGPRAPPSSADLNDTAPPWHARDGALGTLPAPAWQSGGRAACRCRLCPVRVRGKSGLLAVATAKTGHNTRGLYIRERLPVSRASVASQAPSPARRAAVRRSKG